MANSELDIVWLINNVPIYRGVQEVHCVMHKCIMVKLEGKRKTHKVCKKHVNFMKSRGKFAKVGGNNNFLKIWGKCTETAKIGGI